MQISTKKNNKGFTLVETLVAISILTVSILAGFTAVQNSLKSSITAKNQAIAFFLIQDAMEYIKNIRDENALNAVDGKTNRWLDGLVTVSAGVGSGPCDFTKICRIDIVATAPNTVVTCSGTCPVLLQDTVSNSATKGLYGYTAGWTATNFTRTVQFQSVPNVTSDQEVRVIITMTWTQGLLTKTMQISQLLFNRQ